MNIRDYIEYRIEEENKKSLNQKVTFAQPKTGGEIVDLYRSYQGLKRHMRALPPEMVEKYMQNGYAFVGAYYENNLAGIAVNKVFPEEYPYFQLPKNEEKGKVFTLGGLFVRPGYQGLGLASKLARIVTNGTQDYAQATKDGVGIGYEISYDNCGSLKILSQHGNFIGIYNDSDFDEGLSIMLYKPFVNQPVKVDRPNIQLLENQEISQTNLERGLSYLAQQEGIGGLTNHTFECENGNVVTTSVLNNTPLTVPEQTFELVR